MRTKEGLALTNISITKATLWDWVKAISTLTVVGVISYKVYLTPINLTVDFPTLLSLLLALFSVGLAALFYFKATETSNTFYDNTNNFTKDIAQLLARMESGFGEKLRNLDEGYSSMRDYLQNSPSITHDIEDAKHKIQSEKQEIEKVIEERNKIVSTLVDKAQLQEEEKQQILTELSEKEQELLSSQKELSKMNKRLFIDRMRKKDNRHHLDSVEHFTRTIIIPEIGEDVLLNSGFAHVKRRIDQHLNKAPRQYVDDLEQHGYFENGITKSGVEFFLSLVHKSA